MYLCLKRIENIHNIITLERIDIVIGVRPTGLVLVKCKACLDTKLLSQLFVFGGINFSQLG